jgi:hypothetical protein
VIGGKLSKWTMIFFAIAIAWLIAGESLMAASFGFPSADLESPDTLIVVHIICIGWLSTAMCGALFQFVPVLVAKPLFAEGCKCPRGGMLNPDSPRCSQGFMALRARRPICGQGGLYANAIDLSRLRLLLSGLVTVSGAVRTAPVNSSGELASKLLA